MRAIDSPQQFETRSNFRELEKVEGKFQQKQPPSIYHPPKSSTTQKPQSLYSKIDVNKKRENKIKRSIEYI